MGKTDEIDRFNKAVGKRLAKAQKDAGLEDRQLSGLANISERDIQIYKRGDRSMRIVRLPPLAKALNVSCDWLLLGTD